MAKLNKSICLVYPSPPPFGGMATQGNLLQKKLVDEGLKVIHVATNRNPPILGKILDEIPVIRTAARLIPFYFSFFIALIHCRTIHILGCSHLYYYLHILPVICLGQVFGRRVMVNYRGGEAATFFKGIAGKTIGFLKKADIVTVPSGYLQNIFRKLGVKTTIVPNLVETDRFLYSAPTFKDHIRFICTRNFEDYYDVATTIKSFARVKKNLVSATLTLVGDGTLKYSLENLIKELEIEDSVVFKGKLEQEDMAVCLRGHDIFINSSVVDNYPISILEAFASGLPVISTSAGGIPYLVESGLTGLLVKPGDDKGLAKEMIRLARDEPLAKRLAKNAKLVADTHSWEKIWPRLKAEYHLQD